MDSRNDIIILANEFAKEIKNLGIHLKKAMLFGSYAKNQQNEYSDIDIALIADEFSGFGYEDLKLIVKALRNNSRIQVKTYNTEYFLEGDPFIEEISKHGINLDF